MGSWRVYHYEKGKAMHSGYKTPSINAQWRSVSIKFTLLITIPINNNQGQLLRSTSHVKIICSTINYDTINIWGVGGYLVVNTQNERYMSEVLCDVAPW